MKIALVVIAVILAILFASSQDYEEAKAAELEYCQEVADGYPDWRGIAEKVCG